MNLCDVKITTKTTSRQRSSMFRTPSKHLTDTNIMDIKQKNESRFNTALKANQTQTNTLFNSTTGQKETIDQILMTEKSPRHNLFLSPREQIELNDAGLLDDHSISISQQSCNSAKVANNLPNENVEFTP